MNLTKHTYAHTFGQTFATSYSIYVTVVNLINGSPGLDSFSPLPLGSLWVGSTAYIRLSFVFEYFGFVRFFVSDNVVA